VGGSSVVVVVDKGNKTKNVHHHGVIYIHIFFSYDDFLSFDCFICCCTWWGVG
jgi:hypothetical protein